MLVEAGLVGCDVSRVVSMLSKIEENEEFLKADLGELGTEDIATDEECCE